MYVKVMAAVIACILMSGETHSTSATIPATENQSWFKKRKKKPEQEEKTKSDYEKLVEGSKITKGMFAVHQKKNDYYFEIPTSLLGRDLLIVNKLQRVPAELNDAGVNRGVNYENQMVSMEWDKATGKLMFRQQRPLPLAPQTDAIFRSVKDNFISPLIAAFKIEAINQDSTALVIKVNDIYDGTETSINNVFTNINLGTSAIKNLSRILSIKSFPNNVVATSELTTKVTEGTTSVYVTVEVSSSILLLPEKPMTGRFDNQKVGYFTNPLLSFSDAQQGTDKKQYITRWRMEPKPEDREAYLKGQTVEPIKPIVFYIDNSTPYQWRSYIKKGIEDWQTAFEKAGFKNAIIAKEITDSMHVDMDDVNYSVLTYAASEKKKQKWINYKLPGVSIPRGVIIIKKSKRKKSYFWIACSSAFASWSGHDVPRPLQSMPFMREMASFTSMPSTSLATPCVFPLHPPTNCTLCTLPSSTSNRIFLEQVPFVVYSINKILLCE